MRNRLSWCREDPKWSRQRESYTSLRWERGFPAGTRRKSWNSLRRQRSRSLGKPVSRSQGGRGRSLWSVMIARSSQSRQGASQLLVRSTTFHLFSPSLSLGNHQVLPSQLLFQSLPPHNLLQRNPPPPLPQSQLLPRLLHRPKRNPPAGQHFSNLPLLPNPLQSPHLKPRLFHFRRRPKQVHLDYPPLHRPNPSLPNQPPRTSLLRLRATLPQRLDLHSIMLPQQRSERLCRLKRSWRKFSLRAWRG